MTAFLLAACNPFAATESPSPTAAANVVATVAQESTPAATAASQPTAPPATAAPSPTTVPEATLAPTPTVVPEATRELLEIEADAAQVRGLQPKEDVPERFISPEQLRANLEKMLDEHYSREEARRDALELWLMRLIDDREIDLYQLQLDLLSEQVLGYYDPKKDELFVRGDQQDLAPQARETLAHEFVHSLQDQYYDLEKLRPEHINDDDRTMAVTALIEGDATLSGLLYARQYMSESDFEQLLKESGSTEVLDRAPPYIRESLIFPYREGVQFVSALYQLGGTNAINAAFSDPPHSSEQILHPEKYLLTPRDEPLPVTLPALTATLGGGWTYRDSDTLGEFDVGVLLRENGVGKPDQAVAGWGGTRYALYQKGDASVIILGSRWDSPKDAEEFASAMERSLAGLRRVGKVWSGGGRFFGLTRLNDRVAFVGGTDRAAVERALAAGGS
jgi:hypothetical protein